MAIAAAGMRGDAAAAAQQHIQGAAPSQADWEDPRLSITGFVSNYMCWRLFLEDLAWEAAPDLPYGEQPEHEVMQRMAAKFEERTKDELHAIVESLLEESTHTYHRYCIMIEAFGTTGNGQNCMTFGRMVGLFALSGCLAVELTRRGMRRDVDRIALYTSRFVEGGIRLTWAAAGLSWAKFVASEGRVALPAPMQQIPAPPATIPPPSPPPSPPLSDSLPRRRISVYATAAGLVGISAFAVYRVLSRRSLA